MSSELEMSLEEIIMKKNVAPKKPTTAKNGFKHAQRQFKNTPKHSAPSQFQNKPADARNKIILKKRTQITDARDKLAELAKQKDARIKLDQLRLKRASHMPSHGRMKGLSRATAFKMQGRGFPQLPFTKHDTVFMDVTRQVKSRPLISPTKIHLNRQIGYHKTSSNLKRDLNVGLIKPIRRTVENDFMMPRPIIIEDEYDETFRAPLSRKTSLNLKIVAHNDGARERSGGINRTRDRERSPPLPPSILKKRPLAVMNEPKIEKTDSITEYRIIVSNLKNTVSGGDIQELFGDIGGLLESRLVRPGTAEVIYQSLEDAQKAVDLYHNRQLDGQPMNCLLVNPRPMTRPATGSLTQLPPSTSSSVVPDISTFHKVLFSR